MRSPTPRLRPGLTLLRRGSDVLQVGLRRPVALLPDTSAVGRAFNDQGQLVLASDAGLIALLAERGALLERDAAAALRPAVGSAAARRDARDRAASVVRHGASAPAMRDRRRQGVRALLHGPAADDLADEVDAMLRGVGGGGLQRIDPGRGLDDAADGRPVLVISDGEPPREWSDDLVRSDTPHLYLRVVESTVLLGPWVAPGVTACLRCDDLHRAAVDPAWPLLVQQASVRSARPRADEVPTPAEALAFTAAAAGAARELLRHAEGLRPSSWGAETRWGLAGRFDEPSHTGDAYEGGPSRDPAEHGTRVLPRHASCGCLDWSLLAG